jgi:hypothetical protein
VAVPLASTGGTPAPQVVSGQARNPFDEPFEEEELVADRFVPVPSRTACPAPDPGQAAAIEADSPEETSMEAVDAVVGVVKKEGEEELFPEAQGTGRDETSRGEKANSAGTEADATLPMHFETSPDARDDGLAIVVEDEYDDAGPLVCPLPTVRRQEYRQLFAKLRRG